ncbi:MAG: T9SS type A sorting domain-containing protein, partial [Bacteroidales bacterium]|nr:T9SS type A sorting domain-containing protein [Bacteroidales bacterium]
YTGNPSLWLFSQGGSGADLIQVDIMSGTMTGVTHNVLNDINATGDPIAGGAFLTVDYASGFVTLGGLVQADMNIVFGYELATYDQWLTFEPRNGTLLPGAPPQEITLTFDATGYQHGDVKEALATFHSTPDVGVEELFVHMDVKIGIDEVQGLEANIYPIPANDFVNIELSQNVQNIRILNYTGQVVYDQNATDNFVRIDVRDYAAGAYMIEFTTHDGAVVNKRLVVTK